MLLSLYWGHQSALSPSTGGHSLCEMPKPVKQAGMSWICGDHWQTELLPHCICLRPDISQRLHKRQKIQGSLINKVFTHVISPYTRETRHPYVEMFHPPSWKYSLECFWICLFSTDFIFINNSLVWWKEASSSVPPGNHSTLVEFVATDILSYYSQMKSSVIKSS